MLDLNVNIAQAALGAEIDVPTVDGTTKLDIPAGTQPGKVFTLRGKGSPFLRSSGRGDQKVIVNVDVPTKLTADQRKLIRTTGDNTGHRSAPQEKSFVDMLKEVLGG